ncbi:MAG: DUF2442 domain-containing protein [Clostridia bacterium]|jgi:hypothetical protein|nr:DUF2442 domain-containing protein [Clostridia bacterium]MCR5689602.1 DUF2442 domain-containing protein [Clostridiales bacterium]
MKKIRPVSVIPLENHILLIEFNNNERRLFNVAPYISGSWYGMLADENYFKTAHIADGTVEWADGQDIAPHELYETSLPA